MVGSATRKLVGVTAVLAFVSLLNKGVGFLRETALAANFGASIKTDVFLVASLIPVTVFTVVHAAIAACTVPIISGVSSDKQALTRTSVTLLTVSLLATIFLYGLFFVGAPETVRMLAPGFDEASQMEAVLLSRIMMPLIVLQTLNGVLQGILHGVSDVKTPAVSILAFNLMAFLAIAFGANWGLSSLAWGLVGGSALQLGLQVRAVRSFVSMMIGSGWDGVSLGKFARGLLPTLLALGAIQFSFAIHRIYGTLLPEGAISHLNYASRLLLLPVGIFGQALATAIYPLLAKKVADGDHDGYQRASRRGLGLAVLVMIPVCALVSALSLPVVDIAFGRGAFDSWSVQETASILAVGSLLMLGLVLTEILNRVSFARGRMWLPACVGVITVGLTTILGFPAADYFGAPGLIGVTAVGQLVGGITLIAFLDMKLMTRSNCWAVVKMSVSSGAAVVVANLLCSWFWHATGSVWLKLLVLAVSGIGGAVTYFVVAYFMKLFPQDLDSLRGRLAGLFERR